MLNLVKKIAVSVLAAASNGFGDHIKWHNYEEGLKNANISKKPIMLIIYSPKCPACIALKKRFAKNIEIENLSKNFIMINLEKKESISQLYRPDGDYVPRIFFLDSRGNILNNIFNETGEGDVKYFYYDSPSVAKSMKRVIHSEKFS